MSDSEHLKCDPLEEEGLMEVILQRSKQGTPEVDNAEMNGPADSEVKDSRPEADLMLASPGISAPCAAWSVNFVNH